MSGGPKRQTHWSQQRSEFRAWLVNRLTETSWVRTIGRDQPSIAQAARQLGVQPDVLVDARKLLDERARESAQRSGLERIRTRPDGRSVLVAGTKQIVLCMPVEVHEAWVYYRELRGLNDATLLRSLVHHLLLDPRHRHYPHEAWVYEGQVRRMPGRHRTTNWPWTVRTYLSRGANEALVRRSRAVRESKARMLRTIVLDVLEGRLVHFEVIPDAALMFAADRYATLEGKLEDRAVAKQTIALRRSE